MEETEIKTRNSTANREFIQNIIKEKFLILI